MSNFLTYMYLLTPLHTGGSVDEGNLMGIAREVHTEFPYLPSSSLRGRIRAAVEKASKATEESKEIEEAKEKTERNTAPLEEAKEFFGKKIENNSQPTEGEVWFADGTLLFFPIASLSHHLVWITCPLWLARWNRWLNSNPTLETLISDCRTELRREEQPKSAVISFRKEKLYLRTAVLNEAQIARLDFSPMHALLEPMISRAGLLGQIIDKLIVLTDEDCVSLVEAGLQREVRVALKEDSKTVDGGSFRSEEAIPPEAVLFFPWGLKSPKAYKAQKDESKDEILQKKKTKEMHDEAVRTQLKTLLNKNRLQFGGLEGLGRGWVDLTTLNCEEK